MFPYLHGGFLKRPLASVGTLREHGPRFPVAGDHDDHMAHDFLVRAALHGFRSLVMLSEEATRASMGQPEHIMHVN